jgi:magnesium transporter
MLSVYSRQIQNLQQEVQYLLSRLQSKQEFIALALAGYRNRLVRMNVNLGIVGVATGMTTATTGLFGMNLINGFEESKIAFAIVTGGSMTLAMAVAGVYFSFIRGRIMQERAAQRLAEIQTFVNALSDMGALDYTVKKMIQGQGTMDKHAFKTRLKEARVSGQVTDQEVDFLFAVLDTHKDNQLTAKDFSPGGTSELK